MGCFQPPPKTTGCYKKQCASTKSPVHFSSIICYPKATGYHFNLRLFLVVYEKNVNVEMIVG